MESESFIGVVGIADLHLVCSFCIMSSNNIVRQPFLVPVQKFKITMTFKINFSLLPDNVVVIFNKLSNVTMSYLLINFNPTHFESCLDTFSHTFVGNMLNKSLVWSLTHWHTQTSLRRPGSLGPLIHSRL